MPMGPNMLWSACRLTSAGDLLGTAFIVSYPSEMHEGLRWNYLVTAHHVIRNQRPIEVEIPNGFTGELQDPIEVNDWWKPFDDVDLALSSLDAVTRAAQPAEPLNVRGCAMDFQALRPGDEPKLGMTVYYVGVFKPRETPMVRAGVLGTPRIRMEKTHPRKYVYDAHLVDCRSYDGFSGSPCYVELLHPVLNSKIEPFGPFVGDRPDLTDGQEPELGVLASFVPLAGIFTAHYTDEGEETNPDDTVSRYGVGVMLPVRYLWEALMSGDARQQRHELDRMESVRRMAEHFEPKDAAATRTEPDEFERFEDALSKLAQVPKSEIDEQRAKE
jgi:hypothetical protein